MNQVMLPLRIAKNTSFSLQSIQSVLNLLEEGATVPFIARYRKDQTGGLEDHEIFKIQKEAKAVEELIQRKKYILTTIKELKIKDKNLALDIENCWDKKNLEDLFSPYKSNRKTKASIAKENGLEGLARIIMSQKNLLINTEPYIQNAIKTEGEAIEGVIDIICEWISRHAYSKNQLRRLFSGTGILKSKIKKGKEKEAEVYKTYFDFEQKANQLPSHRILAILRGTQEGYLNTTIKVDKQTAIDAIEKNFIKNKSKSASIVKKAISNTYTKSLRPSLEKELLNDLKLKADIEAIQVFSKNLEQLLLASPLGKKNVLAIDPGFKTGCKVVCLNKQGDLLADTIIYPHPPQKQEQKSKESLLNLVKKHRIETIAIGNGTAGRETEIFIKSIPLPKDIAIYLVNENGASIYSASKIGREEFPEHDITVRGAVSIGRRLMDPLAELVKIEPKSIGVGQYQHDVDQALLKTELDHVVEKCVNRIGVQLNTANKHLLQHISGIGPTLANNIVSHRLKNGEFNTLVELKKVARLGDKAFEQCAGFLRVDGKEPLDKIGIHPEQYNNVRKIAKQKKIRIEDLIGNPEVLNLAKDQYLEKEIGKLSLQDILNELAKPNIDPRVQDDQLEFSKHITTIHDLTMGMILQGQVTNITNFGAFIDLGIKENGLVHISQITNKFIKSPSDILSLNQIVSIKIIQIDLENKRIGLTMKI